MQKYLIFYSHFDIIRVYIVTEIQKRRRVNVGKLFDLDNPVFRTIGKLVDLIWLNIIFIIFSLPVVTIGASVTAMMSVTMKMARDREGYIWQGFWKSFKQNFKQSTIIWIIMILVATVLGTDIYFFYTSKAGYAKILLALMLGISIICLCTAAYVFPLQAQFDNTIKQTLKNALLMAIRHLPWTILLMVVLGVCAVLIWLFLAVAIFFGFGLTAFLCSYIFNHIFIRYIPEEIRNDY